MNYKYCSTDSFWVAVLICYSGEGEGADLWIRIPEILSLAGFWWLVYEVLLPTYQPSSQAWEILNPPFLFPFRYFFILTNADISPLLSLAA